jgi:hypothetical protein
MRVVLVLAAQRASVRPRRGCGFNNDAVVVWAISASRALQVLLELSGSAMVVIALG